MGGPLVDLLLGGPIIAGPTLTRFFALHVFVIPGLMLAFAGLHIWMVVGLGINDWPMPGRIVRRSTYIQEYHELTHKDGIPFVPGAVWKDMMFSAAILFAVALCAVFLGPFGPTGFPDPTIIQTVPKPDFFFLWLYTILSFLPENLETPFILIAPVVGIGFLLALPFFAGEGEKSWRRRPIAVLSITVLAVGFAVCQHLGTYTPWSPEMQAWSGDTVPVRYVHSGHAAGAAGPDCFSGEAVPQLPHARRRGRPARPGAGWCGHAAHLRSTRAPGAAGRRKHAGVRKESFPAPGNGAGQLSRNLASRGPAARAGCFAAVPQQRGTRSSVPRFAVR